MDKECVVYWVRWVIIRIWGPEWADPDYRRQKEQKKKEARN